MNDLRPVSTPNGTYCKAPADSPQAVRGVRNAPCPDSDRRSATAAGCGFDFTRPIHPPNPDPVRRNPPPAAGLPMFGPAGSGR